MTCRRCGGFMVVEPTYMTAESNVLEWPEESRCVNCGNVEDAVIDANRTCTPSEERIELRKRGVDIESGWCQERIVL